ncbi:lipopolysaccharide biosynthesis protein [Plantactinospora sp. KBS50]|uniref:lipopolysaccharide biosynthesis protein n=1 Tax=Plantactinospora sp. KBS50 TaxID=2024580 RepID=UPI000BAB01A0|nr:oligosaccharide flippase family protein [Plantactinospora sp. KBS50]ASW54799.1 hypothetical protein CIK06_12330 [Plantactinospora sp. KBS50]
MASATGTDGGRLVRNTLSMLGARIVVALTGLVAMPVVYQHLGPAAFGVWVLLTGLFAIATLLDLGLGAALVREVAAVPTDTAPSRVIRRLLGLGLAWGLVLGTLVSGAFAVGWPWIAQLLRLGELTRDAWHATLWLLLGVVAGGVELPWRAVLEGVQRYGALALVTAVTAVVGAVLAIVAVRLGGGIVGLAASTAATGVIRALVLAGMAERWYRHLTPASAGWPGATCVGWADTGCGCRPPTGPPRSTWSWTGWCWAGSSGRPWPATSISAPGCSTCCGCRPAWACWCCFPRPSGGPPPRAGPGWTRST